MDDINSAKTDTRHSLIPRPSYTGVCTNAGVRTPGYKATIGGRQRRGIGLNKDLF